MDGREGKSEWAEAVGAAALVCAVASLALVAAAGWSWFAKFLESSAAAWIQAIGSIVAIVATGWGVNRTHRLQLEQRKRDMEDAYTELLAVAHGLVLKTKHLATRMRLLETSDVSPLAESRQHTLADLTTLLDVYRRFDTNALLRFEYMQAFMAGESCARQLHKLVESQHHPSMLGVRDITAIKFANLVESRLDEEAKKLADAITARFRDGRARR